MGATKKDQYTENQLNYARIGKAIASPARVAILQHIKTNHFGKCRELSRLINLSEATTHFHLQMLVKTNFISDQFIDDQPAYILTDKGLIDIELIPFVFRKQVG